MLFRSSLGAELRHSRGPRPDLEARLVAAIERHYGPFLSFRPPDRPALLEDVSRLLVLWGRRDNPTREFLEVGLRSDARGVWRQVAAHAGESLRVRMKGFLAGLDPALLAAEPQGFLAWLPAQEPTPWKAEARGLAEAVDAALERAKLPPAAILLRRVRLARALGERERAAGMVAKAFMEFAEDRGSVFALAAEQLRDQGDPVLASLFHRALLEDLPGLSADGSGRSLLVADAERLEADGDFAAAEVLWRSLLGLPSVPPNADDPANALVLERALGSNLSHQQRWEEARFFLEPLTASEKWKAEPTLRFQLAAAESGRGDPEAARRRALEGLALLAEDGPLRPMPGLAAALRLLVVDARGGEAAAKAMERLRRTLDPDSLVPALLEDSVLLALTEGLEPRSDRPRTRPGPTCGGPWTDLGEDPATRGLALLQAANGLRLEDSEPCLREALRHLERVYPDPDPRLQPPLMRLARCLQERDDAGAEAVYRRILANTAAQAGTDPLLEMEARARLGQLLSEQGRDQEADALLREVMERLLRASPDDPKVLEMLGGVVLMLMARLEYREDYPGALQVLEQVEGMLARESGQEVHLATELRDLTGSKSRLLRQARLQTLLRAQGLP